MFVLIRKISAYTGNDIILGVFTDQQKAKNILNNYRDNYLQFPELDPWKEQAYVAKHLSMEQFEISNIESKCITGHSVHLVTKHEEGFGQITTEIDSLHTDKKSALAYCEEADTQAEADMNFPTYYTFQELVVDELSSDADD